MDKTDRLRDYGLAFLLYEQGLGLCGYELIRELFIFVKLILNSYLLLVPENIKIPIQIYNLNQNICNQNYRITPYNKIPFIIYRTNKIYQKEFKQ